MAEAECSLCELIVSMVGAYVDGRPMPRSSSALISDASVYRGGGLVVCPSAVRSVAVTR